MKKLFYFVFTAILFSPVLFAGNLFGADQEEFEKRMYQSKLYDEFRTITYWAQFVLTIRDFRPNSGDAEDLKLVVDKTKKWREYNPREDIHQHFINECKRLFVENLKLPFHDTQAGWEERMSRFYMENAGRADKFEAWQASEEARRRSLYGGHPGSIFCHIGVKRTNFPVLYEIRCNISAKEDLSYSGWVEKQDIGFSSPEHIGGELKTAITEMLKEKSLELTKIKKYGK